MRDWLVCYDYGQGGLWWWITAPSPDAITALYRDVTVFDQPPDFWDVELDRLTPRLVLGESAPGLGELRR